MTTPNDAAEPSLASAGSQPVAWAVLRIDGSIYDVYANEEEAKAIDEVVTGNHGVVPLYRSLALTDEEREAIERLCEAVTEYSDIDRKENGCHADDDMAAVAVARGLMKRMV